VQTALYGIGFVHDANPCTETGIREAVAKSRDSVANNEHGEWRVRGENGVGDNVAQRSQDGNATLAQSSMDGGVCERCKRVAGKGR
jgi:hypothetical protein